MKANIPKRQKPPKSWDRLPEYEQKAILEYFSQVFIERANHEDAELQKKWLKLACIVLHRQKDPYGKMRCTAFLKEWKRAYNTCSKYKTNEELDAWLKVETDKIFGVDGYPDEWVDGLENRGNGDGTIY